MPLERGTLVYRDEKNNLAQAYHIVKSDGIYHSSPCIIKANRNFIQEQIEIGNGMANLTLPFLAFIEHGLVYVVFETRSLYTCILLEGKYDEVGSLVTYSKTHVYRAPNGFKYLWKPPVARLP